MNNPPCSLESQAGNKKGPAGQFVLGMQGSQFSVRAGLCPPRDEAGPRALETLSTPELVRRCRGGEGGECLDIV